MQINLLSINWGLFNSYSIGVLTIENEVLHSGLLSLMYDNSGEFYFDVLYFNWITTKIEKLYERYNNKS